MFNLKMIRTKTKEVIDRSIGGGWTTNCRSRSVVYTSQKKNSNNYRLPLCKIHVADVVVSMIGSHLLGLLIAPESWGGSRLPTNWPGWLARSRSTMFTYLFGSINSHILGFILHGNTVQNTMHYAYACTMHFFGICLRETRDKTGSYCC